MTRKDLCVCWVTFPLQSYELVSYVQNLLIQVKESTEINENNPN